jgi:hypothetical protein
MEEGISGLHLPASHFASCVHVKRIHRVCAPLYAFASRFRSPSSLRPGAGALLYPLPVEKVNDTPQWSKKSITL